MHFWNTQSLADKIKHSLVSEREWKNYYLINLFFTCPVFIIFIVTALTNPPTTYLFCLLIILFTFLWIQLSFYANGGNQGLQYIPRILALSLPLRVKAILAYAFAFFVFALIQTDLSYSFFMLYLFIESIVCWRLCVHLRGIHAYFEQRILELTLLPVSDATNLAEALDAHESQTSDRWKSEL